MSFNLCDFALKLFVSHSRVEKSEEKLRKNEEKHVHITNYHILHKILNILHKIHDSLLLSCYYRVTNGQNFVCLRKKFIRSESKKSLGNTVFPRLSCVLI